MKSVANKTSLSIGGTSSNSIEGRLRNQSEGCPQSNKAEAKIKVATAEGNAQALLTQAKAEAEANRMKQATLTPLLIQQQYIDKWNGVLPVYGQVPQLFKSVE